MSQVTCHILPFHHVDTGSDHPHPVLTSSSRRLHLVSCRVVSCRPRRCTPVHSTDAAAPCPRPHPHPRPCSPRDVRPAPAPPPLPSVPLSPTPRPGPGLPCDATTTMTLRPSPRSGSPPHLPRASPALRRDSEATIASSSRSSLRPCALALALPPSPWPSHSLAMRRDGDDDDTIIVTTARAHHGRGPPIQGD